MANTEITVADNDAQHRYDAFVAGDLAGSAMYHDDAGRRVFTHTKVDPDYEGHGVGSELARGALEDVRRRGLTVVARCPFISGYIDQHPEYADLIARN